MSRLDEIKANKQRSRNPIKGRSALKLLVAMMFLLGTLFLIKVYFLQNKSIQEFIQENPSLAQNSFVQLFSVDTSIADAPAVWGEDITDEHAIPALHLWLEAKAVNYVNVLAVTSGEAQIYAQLPGSAHNVSIYSNGYLLFLNDGAVWSWMENVIQKQYSLIGVNDFYFEADTKNLYFLSGSAELGVLKPNGTTVSILQNAEVSNSNFQDVRIDNSLIYLKSEDDCTTVNLTTKAISNGACELARVSTDGLNPMAATDPTGEVTASTKGIIQIYNIETGKYQQVAVVEGSTFSMLSLSKQRLVALQSEIAISPLGLASRAPYQVVVYNMNDGTEIIATGGLPPGSELKDLSLDIEGNVYALVEELGEEYEQLWEFDVELDDWVQVTVPGCELGCDLAFIE